MLTYIFADKPFQYKVNERKKWRLKIQQKILHSIDSIMPPCKCVACKNSNA